MLIFWGVDTPKWLYLNGITFSKAHHFGALQPLVVGGVYTLLGGSSQLGYVVNNHGEYIKSPKWGCGTPYKWPNWLIMGVTNHLLSGMILQVGVGVSMIG